MSNMELGGGRPEESLSVQVAVDTELARRDADANHGSLVHLIGGVVALPSLVWLQPEQDYLRTMQATGFDPMQHSSFTGVAYWLQQAANLPVDYKGAAFAAAVGTATYGARLVGRRDRFPIDQAKAYEQLNGAISYDPSTANKYAVRRKIGDVAVAATTAGVAYMVGEQLDTLQAVMATVAASMGGFAAMLGSKVHTAVYRAKLQRRANRPITRPGLEDGKTIH